MILKPDAAERNLVGSILSKIEASGLKIVRLEMLRLTPERARKFYHVHEGKPFLDDLVGYMSRGPVVVGAPAGESAITRWRELMGATNPANAAPGTIRKEFAESIEANSVHGSDSADNAKIEIGFFFSGTELVG